LELGSGRSTITLGEYCKSFGGLLISIETERDWYDKARFELGAMMLPTSSVKLLRIDQDTGWYDESSWASALAGETALDLVFVDAPNRHDGRSQGMRDSASALRLLKVACANASVVVIDDVHRAHILSAVDPMLGATSDFHKHFYDYQVIPDYPNAVCICTRKGTAVDHAISRIAELAGLVLYPDYLLQNCPEE
jgi:predicted O-methyltransferase YrrM